ncbi:MAG: asparagine synthase-related protein [Acidobacteriota bacterium]|nr:asparagine synthase-related protein [Acidobacteriota bacterium]
MFVRISPHNCSVQHSNHYPGFGNVVTTTGKTIFLKGAPRLYQEPARHTPITKDKVVEYTDNIRAASLVQKLLPHVGINSWGDYLTGNFLLVVVDTPCSQCHIISDIGNSFHLYQYSSPDHRSLVFSTHIDELAQATGKDEDIDYVSITEHLIQESITYPHTAYSDLYEFPYASCLSCDYSGEIIEISERQYWLPTCYVEEASSDITDLSCQLRKGLVRTVEQILSPLQSIGLFMSGGLDSRVLGELIVKCGKQGLAITISDTLNLEIETARKAAAAIGLEHKVLLRDLEYYPNLINDLLALEGPHANFNRGSFLGFQKELGKYDLDAFMGGYMSDTLLKLHEANVKARLFLGRHSGTLERFDSTPIQYLRGGNHYIDDQFSSVFKADLLDQIQQRRETILDYWENLRTDGSAWEWSYMWPFTRNKHNTNLTTNIFVHPAFEVYTDRSVIEIARIATQQIKINGRLFNKAVYPLMERSRKIPLANTTLPLFSSIFWGELAISAKHFPPRRWLFKEPPDLTSNNPAATNRSFPDFRVIWEESTLLEKYRSSYDASDLEEHLMNPHPRSVFDRARYQTMSDSASLKIMSNMLHLDRWIKMKRVKR